MKTKRVIGMLCMLLIVMLPFSSAYVFGLTTSSPIINNGNTYSSNLVQDTLQPRTSTFGYDSNQYFSGGSQDTWYNQESLQDKMQRWTSGMGLASAWGDPIDLGESIVVNVADYEPKIVRSAMLEQQDLPVFVYLRGTTFGTLGSLVTGEVDQKDPLSGIKNIPPINYVDVEWNKDNPYVAGVQVIAPRDGTYSMDNLGYVMVYLKQLESEDDLPSNKKVNNSDENFIDKLTSSSNVVDIEMTAKIYFDFSQQGLLNIGPETLVLKNEPDENAFLNKVDHITNAFYSGRGYIRASSINPGLAGGGAGTVSLIIYDKEMRPFSSILPGPYQQQFNPARFIRLTEGNVESNIRIGSSGNPLEDYISIRLDSVVGPEDRAVIELNVGSTTQKRITTKNKRLYPNSQWFVISLDNSVVKGTEASKAKAQIASGLDIANNPNAQIYRHTLRISNGYEQKSIVRYTLEDGTGSIQVSSIDQQQAEYLEEKYCASTLKDGSAAEFYTGLPGVEPKESDKTYACRAVANLRKIIQGYGSSPAAEEAYKSLGDIYANKLIDYNSCDIISWDKTTQDIQFRDEIKCTEFKRDMNKLAYYYYNIVSTKYPASLASFKESVNGVGGEFSLESEGVSGRLKYVDKIEDYEKGSFTYRVENGNSHTAKVGETLKGVNGIDLVVNSESSVDKQYKWNVSEIQPNYVILKKYYNNGKSGTTYNAGLGDKRQLIVNDYVQTTNGVQKSIETVDLEILEIDMDTMAFLTVIPGSGQAVSSSNFTIHIPIEPRPFELTPDQIKSQMAGTQEMVDWLDGTIDNLYNIVKVWKKVCILTFGVLTVKNMFEGSAKAKARGGVSHYYKTEVCQGQVGLKNTYATLDECLFEYGDEISEDVKKEAAAYTYVDKQFSGKTTAELIKEDQEGNLTKFLVSGGTIDQYMDYERYRYLQTQYGDEPEGYGKNINENLDLIGYNKKIALYDAAEGLFQDQYKNLGPEGQKKFKEQMGAKDDNEVMTRLISSIEGKIDSNKPIDGNLIPVDVISFKGEGGATAFNPIVSGKKLESIEKLELVRPTQLAYNIYLRGADAMQKEAEAARDAGNYVTTMEFYEKHYANQLATSSNGNPIYITSGSVIKAGAAGNSKGYPGGANFNLIGSNSKFYTSSVVQQGDRVLNAKYAPTQTMIAEYGVDGYVTCAPTGTSGEYFLIQERYKTGAPAIFEIRNVGPNGLIECYGGGDDLIVYDDSALKINTPMRQKYSNIIQKYTRCEDPKDVAARNVGDIPKVMCSNEGQKIAEQASQPKCIDTMDPSDCQLLFNACDPVMCPSSRCNLQGRYQVDDVIGSGIVGSTVLCWNNKDNGVYMPVCLTGILAGLNNIRSILQGYIDCLDIKLNKNENIGICDEMRSIGICEIVWREGMNIIKMRGGILDSLVGKATSKPQGGAEYLTFRDSLDNAEKSFDYFTTEYKNSFLGYYQGKGSEEIGTQICQMQIKNKLPTFGEFLDKMSEPEDPPQFTAFFDSAPYATQAGAAPGVSGISYNTQEVSQYRVFYHLYAGTGFQYTEGVIGGSGGFGDIDERPLTYMVYLKGPGLSPLYVTTPELGAGTQFVSGSFGTGSSSIERGSSTQQTVQKIGAKGYNEICLNINGQEECGFGKVSSSFTLNWANDQITGADARTNITSADQCVPEVSTTSAALGSLVTPESYGMLSTGIVRVCNPTIPTAEPYRWASVGVCGIDDETGMDRGTCWLDKNSVSIKDALLNEQTQQYLNQVTEGYQFGMMNIEDAKLLLASLNKNRDKIIKELNSLSFEGISKIHSDLARDPIKEAKQEYENNLYGNINSGGNSDGGTKVNIDNSEEEDIWFKEAEITDEIILEFYEDSTYYTMLWNVDEEKWEYIVQRGSVANFFSGKSESVAQEVFEEQFDGEIKNKEEMFKKFVPAYWSSWTKDKSGYIDLNCDGEKIGQYTIAIGQEKLYSDYLAKCGGGAECMTDTDCEIVETCLGGQCVAQTLSCATDEDCPLGKSCGTNFICEDLEMDLVEIEEVCEWSYSSNGKLVDDCPDGEICINETCSKMVCESNEECNKNLVALGEFPEGVINDIVCNEEGFCIALLI